jgi:iron complex transport system substrate-binding protein
MNTTVRIASLLSSATEMLYLLGLGDSVVGVSHECDYPMDAASKPRLTRSHVDSTQSSAAIDEQVKSLLAAGQPLYEVDAELLCSLRPSLIVTQAQCDVCAIKYEDVLKVVNETSDLRQTPIVALNPQSLDDVLNDIERIGDAIGAEQAGHIQTAALRDRVEGIRAKTAEIAREDWPRVACIEWTSPLMLAANWLPEMVEIAGGRHDLTQSGVHSSYSSWQDLLDYNPQVIVVMPCGFSLDRAVAEGRPLSQRAGWSTLSAVQNNRVFAVDANAYFNRPGPRLVDTLELLAHFIHPHTFNPPLASLPAWQPLSK